MTSKASAKPGSPHRTTAGVCIWATLACVLIMTCNTAAQHTLPEYPPPAQHAPAEYPAPHDENAAVQHADSSVTDNRADEASHGLSDAESHADDDPHGHHPPGYQIPPLWAVVPFALLLLCIALLPLIHRTEPWWEHNRNRLFVALVLSVLVLGFYWFVHPGVVNHTTGELCSGFMAVHQVLKHAILGEYIPFIVLLFSLYVISGGIQLKGDLPPRPLTNLIFLAVGAAIASFIGTTGAAMLLIRPMLQINSRRAYVKHTVIFFIFLVCNVGGSLLPIGDPPLFLGYLKGVPFLWTLGLWPQWLAAVLVLLGIYYVWESLAYRKEDPAAITRPPDSKPAKLQLRGKLNFVWLAGVVLSVALLIPGKPFLGRAGWPIVPPFFREIMQLVFVALSLAATAKIIRRENRFNYTGIAEVAALFIGIFITMQVPVEILNAKGAQLGLSEPWHFFWATGILSSFLDNASTYVVFFETAKTLGGADLIAGVASQLLIPISLGAVLMGANTYIGNGSNFMVKSIAEQNGIKMPSFFGYILYSVAVLVPVFILMTWVLNSVVGHWNLP